MTRKIAAKEHFKIFQHFDVSKLAGFEYTDYFNNNAITSSDSYIALTSKNIRKCYIDLNEFITIDKKIAAQFLKRSKLNNNDIVLSYTGEYRRAAVITDDIFQLGPNVCRLTPLDKIINPYYLCAFMNSVSGQKLLDREKTLSAQPTVAMQRIREIEIPKFSNEYQNFIEDCMRIALKYLELSNSEFNKAKADLMASISWENICLSQENISIINSNSVLIDNKRFDAEYYLKKYLEINKFLNEKHADQCNFNIHDSLFSPILNNRYKYIELSNISKNGTISDVEEIIGNKLPSRARRLVHKGQLLISSVEGSIEKCALVNEDFDLSICSTGFHVIDSNYYNSETLLVLFKSEPIQLMLKQKCNGTILASITKESLNTIKLPFINKDVQKNIQKIIRTVNTYQKNTKIIFDSVIECINEAIETNEIEAIHTLKNRLGGILNGKL